MFQNGVPVFVRPFGHGFTIVIEGKPGPSGRPVGRNAFNSSSFDPTLRPDLQIIVSRPLGDGSLAVCDDTLPFIGGVPASQSFALTQAISDAINDFACRFVDGSGNPGGRSPPDACTRQPDGEFRFANSSSTVQFCGTIAQPFAFPTGDTTVTVQLRDSRGDLSSPASLIIRVSE
jgi:hypothetical protein